MEQCFKSGSRTKKCSHKCSNKDKKEEDAKPANVDVNHAGFKFLENWLYKCFVRKVMHSTHLLGLKDAHNVFRRDPTNEDIILFF